MLVWLVNFDLAGTPTDLDSEPILTVSNTANSSIVLGPTAMTRIGVGEYSLTQTNDIGGQTYRGLWEGTITVNGTPVDLADQYDQTSPAGYLTTLANVKLFAGETGTSNDTKYTACLAAATAFIQKWCDQDFLAGTYTELHDGPTEALELHHRPITDITRIATRPVCALTVQNSGSNVGRATVAVSSTGITLSSTAAGSTTTNTLLFSSNLTITALATAISLISGWTATADLFYGRYNSSDLTETTTVSASAYDGPAELHVYADELSYHRRDDDRGMIYGCFSAWGNRVIEVKYSAGSGTVPDDVQSACASLAVALFRKSNTDSFLQSERIGDYSYSTGQQVSGVLISDLNRFCPDAAMLLQAYRRMVVV